MIRSHLLIVLCSVFLGAWGCAAESPWDTSIREAQEAIERGEYDFAEGILLEILPQAEVWGEADRRLAATLYHLGEIYRRQNQLAKAEPYFWRALPIWAKSLGAEHPEMATTLTSLAHIYEARQEYQKAEPLVKQALKIREKAFGLDHTGIVPSLEDYSSLLTLMDREEEAKTHDARRRKSLSR